MTTPVHIPVEELAEQRHEEETFAGEHNQVWCSRAEEEERDTE